MNTRIFNQLALQDFEYAKRKAFWRDLFSRLTRKSNNLLSFDQIRQGLPFTGQHHQGLQAIALDKIVGSKGRYDDFDRAFFPRQTRTRDRWVSIDQAYYEQAPLPPVELDKIGEMYFVTDGHHRVSVARARGLDFIDAYVTELDVSVPIPEKLAYRQLDPYGTVGGAGGHRAGTWRRCCAQKKRAGSWDK